MNKNKFYEQAILFLTSLDQGLSEKSIEVAHLTLDHICYRCETVTEYNNMKALLSTFSLLLTEELIGGRPISTFLLDSAIDYKNRKIVLIELPQPKPGRFYTSGFEHAEFVLQDSLSVFGERYPYIDWDKKGLSKSYNPDLRLFLDKQMSVKFHAFHLSVLIAREQNSVLSVSKEYYSFRHGQRRLKEIEVKDISKLSSTKVFRDFCLKVPDWSGSLDDTWNRLCSSYKSQHYGLLGIYDENFNCLGFVGVLNSGNWTSGRKLHLLYVSEILTQDELKPYLNFVRSVCKQMGHIDFLHDK